MKLLALSGFIPEHICDIIRFTGYAGDQTISHYCGYVSDYISQVINDTNIDGGVYPRSCDSTRIISSYLRDSGKFTYQMNVPARQNTIAVDFLASNIMQYKCALEEHFEIEIKDVFERTNLINQRNRDLQKLYDTIGDVSYVSYLESLHNMLKQPLLGQKIPVGIDNKVSSGKKIYLVGSFMANYKIADLIEKSGLKIAGDNLTESKRLFSAPEVSLNGDIYKNIAESMLNNKLSPTQNNFSSILNIDLEEIKRKNIKGVLFVTQKYCEPYDYLYSVYKKMLDENGIAIYKLSLSDSTDNRVMEAALEAFADIL